jgi:hypothetical protein
MTRAHAARIHAAVAVAGVASAVAAVTAATAANATDEATTKTSIAVAAAAALIAAQCVEVSRIRNCVMIFYFESFVLTFEKTYLSQ